MHLMRSQKHADCRPGRFRLQAVTPGAEGSPHVKIGKTTGVVAKRVALLQTGYPARLSILAQVRIEADLDRLEKALHQMLESQHIYGEWFAIEVDQVQLEALIVRAVQGLAEGQARKAMHIGGRIQQLRMEHKLTQKELADRAGVSQAIISRLETDDRDNVTSDVLKGLAKVLGCTTDYLVGMHEEDDSEASPAAASLIGV